MSRNAVIGAVPGAVIVVYALYRWSRRRAMRRIAWLVRGPGR